MQIRFLKTTESSAPGYPFQPGQIVDLPTLTPDVRRWLSNGHAEVLPSDEGEVAIVEDVERAVRPRARKAR